MEQNNFRGHTFIGLRHSLLHHLEEDILPQYNDARIDPGHNLQHILDVIKQSIYYASQPELEKYNINMAMVQVISTFHDLGGLVDRTNHGEESAILLRKDKVIQSFFAPSNIDVMADAIIRHRSIYRGCRGTIYGLILADADKEANPITFLRRLWGYRNHPGNKGLKIDKLCIDMSPDEKIADLMDMIDLVFTDGGKMDGFELNLKVQEGLMDNIKKTLHNRPEEVMRIITEELGAKLN